MSRSADSVPAKKFSVAIVGAGLGGLALALVLQKDCPDVQVDIYESNTELTEVGAGIGVWPRVWEVLRYLGLEEGLKQAAGAPQSIRFSKADEAKAIDFYEFTPALYTFHRSVLLKLLGGHVQNPSSVFHFSKRLDSYTHDPTGGSVSLAFKDGTHATCDLLVGSDGIRSTVRRVMYTHLADVAEVGEKEELKKMIEPVWSGWVANRGLIPAEMLSEAAKHQAGRPTIFVGKDKNIVCYPMMGGKMFNVAAFVGTPGGKVPEDAKYDGPWVTAVSAEDVAAQFTLWDENVQGILKCMQNPHLWAMHTVRKLPTYVSGNVALLGDAAHAMTTFQASGAGQAIEDGFILGSILAQPSVTRATLSGALAAYDTVRRPFAQSIQARSHANGDIGHLRTGPWAAVTPEQSAAGGFPHAQLVAVAEEVEGLMNWVIDGTMMGDRDKVIEMVKGLGA